MIHTLLLLILSTAFAQPQVIDRIAAVVNDEVITLREAERSVTPLLASIARIDDLERRQRERAQVMERAIEDLVGQTLVLQEARKLKLDASDAEVDAWLNNLKRQYGWDDQAMTKAIAGQGTTMARYREDVRKRILTNRVVQMKLGSSVRVSEADLEDGVAREMSGGADIPELEARHILFIAAENAPEDEVLAKQQAAITLLTQLQNGDFDFPTAARRFSEGPTAARGGSLGRFRPGQLDPAFEKAALSAAVGDVVGPIRTPFGWHIIQVTRRRVIEQKNRDQIREKVRAQLRQEGLQRELKRWVEQLKTQSHVENRIGFLR